VWKQVFTSFVAELTRGNYHALSDMAAIVHADRLGGNTKGSYPAIYYWR
jgi:hypothetical protein